MPRRVKLTDSEIHFSKPRRTKIRSSFLEANLTATGNKKNECLENTLNGKVNRFEARLLNPYWALTMCLSPVWELGTQNWISTLNKAFRVVAISGNSMCCVFVLSYFNWKYIFKECLGIIAVQWNMFCSTSFSCYFMTALTFWPDAKFWPF